MYMKGCDRVMHFSTMTTTNPDAEGTPLPDPTSDEIVASKPDPTIFRKAKATTKRKASRVVDVEASIDDDGGVDDQDDARSVVPVHSFDRRTGQKVDTHVILLPGALPAGADRVESSIVPKDVVPPEPASVARGVVE
ncbi:hypothetical protein Tco_0161142, partial [Tanacetum coccineum]